jgi:transcriptional regulator with XRE-family HTH domain
MLKLRIGTKLNQAREDRKLNQNEMAELLGVSPSTYSRIERNEASLEFEQIAQFAKTLQLPIHDFLPENTAINNSHSGQGHGGGIVFGNIYNYADSKEINNEIQTELKLIKQENTFLKEKIALLEGQIEWLKNK